jgi:hypothetical protein
LGIEMVTLNGTSVAAAPPTVVRRTLPSAEYSSSLPPTQSGVNGNTS